MCETVLSQAPKEKPRTRFGADSVPSTLEEWAVFDLPEETLEAFSHEFAGATAINTSSIPKPVCAQLSLRRGSHATNLRERPQQQHLKFTKFCLSGWKRRFFWFGKSDGDLSLQLLTVEALETLSRFLRELGYSHLALPVLALCDVVARGVLKNEQLGKLTHLRWAVGAVSSRVPQRMGSSSDVTGQVNVLEM